MEPASNFRNSAAAPFCSHSKTINASLANYDTPGFKLGQLLETRAAEAVATIRHGIVSSGSNRPEQAHFSLGSLGRFAHKTLHGECVTKTRHRVPITSYEHTESVPRSSGDDRCKRGIRHGMSNASEYRPVGSGSRNHRPRNFASRKNWRAERQQTMRACYPWIDRVRLPAT
jgi:hypothetical protein